MSTPPLEITAHALLRYLQRHYGCKVDELKVLEQMAETYGLDLEEVYAEFEALIPSGAARVLGNGKYPAGYGRIVVKNNTVLTYLEE